MLTTFSFEEKEKQFFEIYQQLLIRYYSEPQKLKLLLEIKALDLGLENPEKTLEKIEEFLREYLFFKSQRGELEKILPVNPEVLKVLKKFPYFVEYTVSYKFPDSALYRGFKWREPLLLAGGNDGLVRIWKHHNGKFIYLKSLGERGEDFPNYEVYKGHLFYSNGSNLKIYYLPSGKEVADIDVGHPVAALNLEGGKLYLFKKVGNIAIKQRVDIEEGVVSFGPADPVAPTQVESGETDMSAAEGKLLKLKEGKILLFTGEKKEEVLKLERKNLFKFNFPINDIYPFKTSAVVGTDNTPPVVIDINSGEIVAKLDLPVVHTYRVRKNPTRDEIALSHSDNLISIWDTNTLQPIRILESYFIDVLALDYSPDGKYLAAAGEGRDINIWDTESWKMVKDLELPYEGITALAFSPDGKYLAAGCGDNDIYLIDTQNWEVVGKLSYHEDLISDLIFSKDGKHLISASWDGKALLWNLETGEVERILESSTDRVWKLSLSKDGKFLAVADWKGKVSVFKTDGWNLVETFIGKSGVTAVAFGEEVLLIGRKDGTVEVVELRREERFSSEGIKELSKNPSEEAVGITIFEGNLLAYTKGKHLAVWNSMGDKVFSAKVEGELKEVENLREPRAEIKILPKTYIVKKDGYFFGAKGWEDYINILKGLEIVEDKSPFLKEIAKPEILKEL